MDMKVGLVVPTLNAGELWQSCVESIQMQTLTPDRILVVDSESTDQTVQIASKAGFETLVINRKDFSHGGTRQLAVGRLDDCEFVVFLTQDAILSDRHALAALLSPFNDPAVAAVCGRQLPRLAAGAIESHSRVFNYPGNSNIIDLADRKQYGMKTAFISNAFSAYRIAVLKQVGGFPADVILSEDMFVAAKMLLAGWKIAYTGDACVNHSHDYSLLQEFSRYFDIGVFHSRESWIRAQLGDAEGEGLRYVRSECGYLYRHAWWRIPEAFLRSVLKFSGYRIGLLESRLPLWLKQKLAMNPVYFQ